MREVIVMVTMVGYSIVMKDLRTCGGDFHKYKSCNNMLKIIIKGVGIPISMAYI
jgi:hypothetical protein